MVDSVSGNSMQTRWQALQAAQAARSTGPVSPVSAASAVSAGKTASVQPRYDKVEISPEGQSYAASQAAGANVKRADNAALLKELNTADSSGLSYIQQQMISFKAGIPAGSLLGGSTRSSVGSALFSLDMSSLMDSYTQSRQAHTILRGAGVSALGLPDTKQSGGAADGAGTEGGETEPDLSSYSLGGLSKLLSDGAITKEQYLAEGANRRQQQKAGASQSGGSAVSAAVGAAAQ